MIKVHKLINEPNKYWSDLTGRVIYGAAIAYADSQNFRVYSIKQTNGIVTLVRV